jgi:hypothetical protein
MDQSRKRRWLHVPSPSMIVACIALFVAMGGTSYAAIKLPANSVGTKQIKNSAVTNGKLAKGAVGPARVGKIPGARVRHAASAVTINSGSTAILSWDTVNFNVGGVFDPTQPTRMTAHVAGRYLIIATARWDSNVNGRRTIALEVNGTAVQIARSNVSPLLNGGATFYPEQTAQAVYKLNAGDYVQVWAAQDSGAPLNLMTGVDNGVTFSMEWIAP